MREELSSVLIVDDDPSFSDTLKTALAEDFAVEIASTFQAALACVQKSTYPIVLLDLGLPDGDGMNLLGPILSANPSTSVLIITMLYDVPKAVAAIQGGAEEYVTKDLGLDEILRVVRKTAARQVSERELASLRLAMSNQSHALMFNEVSPLMREISKSISQVAPLPSRVSVLIEGESGTGKELVAREIHRGSHHPNAPFVSVNLAAVPKELMESSLFGHEKGSFTGAHSQQIGKFEQAAEGTLLLDEIGCIPPEVQSKLLRVLQEREFERIGGRRMIPVCCRVVAATHRNLPEEISSGRFREDLYYRLRVFPICVPPLRERTEQIPLLGRYFFEKYLVEFAKSIVNIESAVLETLSRHPWLGNVRELENLMQRLAVVNNGAPVHLKDLPQEFRSIRCAENCSLPSVLEQYERDLIEQALRKYGGNQRRAAEELQIPLSTLKFKLRRYGLSSMSLRQPEVSVVHSV